MHRFFRTVPFCVALVLVGCAKHPPVVYEPQLALADIAPGLTVPDSGFVLLADVHTQGRFATPLAIAKFALVQPSGWRCDCAADKEARCARPSSTPGPPQLVALHPAEQAWWTESLRGVAALANVQFLRPLSTKPEPPEIPELCAAAQRVGARLLLVYLPNGYGPNSAQVVGALFETRTATPLATLRSTAHCIDPETGEELSLACEPGDHRDHDANWQAQRAFERYALACLAELIHRDAPPPATQPHRWHTPELERWWIYRR